MLILIETSAGYALFKISDKKLNKIDDIYEYLQDTDQAQKLVTLQAFKQFKDTTDALKSTAKLIAGKIPKTLTKFLEKNIVQAEIQETLEVADKKLGKQIQETLGIQVQTGNVDLYRGLKSQLDSLVQGLSEDDMKKMRLGLAHGLSRYKLQFSVEKVDTMIIQSIALLDDLDKELNNYMMRLREWYGWHFPEISKIVTDNLIYSKTVRAIGMRHNASTTDLSGILPEELEKEVKQAAEISMGTEINDEDQSNIQSLAQQIIDLSTYRETLSEYLKNRMQAIAPNLTQMVGELVGARLISHAGSLINLAKFPASTVQILGAEKALFKAIRTKKNTPKYGLLYQASFVGSAATKIKGKISRALAAKCALCIRCDALGEAEEAEIGTDCKTYIEKRLNFLEKSEIGLTQAPQKQAFGQNKAQGGYNAKSDIQMSRDDLRTGFVKASTNEFDSTNTKRGGASLDEEQGLQKKFKKGF